MRPFYHHHPDSWALIPTISIHVGRCECCDEIGGLAVSLDWLFGSVGFDFDLPDIFRPSH